MNSICIVADAHGRIMQRVESDDEQGLKNTLDGLLCSTESVQRRARPKVPPHPTPRHSPFGACRCR